MSIVDRTLDDMRRNPRNVRFDDLRKVCDHYFGEPRQRGSHLFYRMPWQGRPLVNIQPVRGMAKAYQVPSGAQGNRQIGGNAWLN